MQGVFFFPLLHTPVHLVEVHSFTQVGISLQNAHDYSDSCLIAAETKATSPDNSLQVQLGALTCGHTGQPHMGRVKAPMGRKPG